MLEKKQKDRITLAQVKEHPFFRKNKILFEVQQSEPRPSFLTECVNIDGIIGSNDSPTTLRTMQLKIAEEKRLLEAERKRADSRRENHLRSENTITLVEGDSVKKINSKSIPSFTELERAQSHEQGSEKTGGEAHPGHPERSKFSFEHIKTFNHVATMTDPITVLGTDQNFSEELDNEYRMVMRRFTAYKDKRAALEVVM